MRGAQCALLCCAVLCCVHGLQDTYECEVRAALCPAVLCCAVVGQAGHFVMLMWLQERLQCEVRMLCCGQATLCCAQGCTVLQDVKRTCHSALPTSNSPLPRTRCSCLQCYLIMPLLQMLQVVTFTADLGQGEELEPARKKVGV